jgi:hypothetical protein
MWHDGSFEQFYVLLRLCSVVLLMNFYELDFSDSEVLYGVLKFHTHAARNSWGKTVLFVGF